MSKITLAKKVEEVLTEFPETRNCDILLTTTVWKKYYMHFLTPDLLSDDLCVRLEYIKELPREDHVKRIRAKIQNEEGRLLPTRWEVAKQRKIEEQKWRAFMGYPQIGENNQYKLC